MFMERPVDETDTDVGIETFQHLVHAVERCIAAGRFRAGDPVELATQIWALSHGLISLHLAALLSEAQVLESFSAGGLNQFKAFGDDAAASGRSMTTALRRLGLREARP